MKSKSNLRLNKSCIYCGYEVPLTSSKHKECETRHHDGLNTIKKQTKKFIIEDGDLESLEWMIRDVAVTSFISRDEQNGQMRKGFEEGVVVLKKAGKVSIEKAKLIDQFIHRFPFIIETREDNSKNSSSRNKNS